MEPQVFDKTDPKHIDAFYAYTVAMQQHHDPDDPVTPKETFVKNITTQNPKYEITRWFVWQDGEIIASLYRRFTTEKSPDYNHEKNQYAADISVHPRFRRQGWGSRLTRFLFRDFLASDKQRFRYYTASDEGRGFLSMLDFGKLLEEGAQNRLYVSDIDWNLMKSWKETGEKRNPDTKLVKFTRVPDDLLAKYTKFYTYVFNLQPKGADDWEFTQTPESRREEEALFNAQNMIWYSIISQKEDGRISGMTEMLFTPEMPHRALQELTAVDLTFRGNGLGKWLKAVMLEDILELHPEIKYIITGNADENAPMLAINQQMGFQRYRAAQFYQATRDQVTNHPILRMDG